MQLVRNDVLLDEDNLTTSISAVVDLSQLSGVAIQFVYIKIGLDPLDATVKLQASNDGTNFADLHGASYHIIASGNVTFNCSDAFFKWLKAVYIPVSGTVHIQAIIAADDGKQ